MMNDEFRSGEQKKREENIQRPTFNIELRRRGEKTEYRMKTRVDDAKHRTSNRGWEKKKAMSGERI